MENDKPPILGLIQRGGQVVLRMLANVRQATIKPVITAAVVPGPRKHGINILRALTMPTGDLVDLLSA